MTTRKIIHKNNQNDILGIVLGIALVVAAWMISNGLAEMRRADRYVTVKGLAERDVRADIATWQLTTRASGDELVGTQARLQQQLATIIAFTKDYEMTDKELEIRGYRVVDRLAQEYGEMRPGQSRYIVEASVFLRSKRVDKVEILSSKIGELVESGVTLIEENRCNSGPNYLFTELNKIKPEMLREATKNARMAAAEFARNSDSEVAAIRRANQGFFSISPRDRVSESMEGGGCGPSDPNKKIRVVTTIDYYLEN